MPDTTKDRELRFRYLVTACGGDKRGTLKPSENLIDRRYLGPVYTWSFVAWGDGGMDDRGFITGEFLDVVEQIDGRLHRYPALDPTSLGWEDDEDGEWHWHYENFPDKDEACPVWTDAELAEAIGATADVA